MKKWEETIQSPRVNHHPIGQIRRYQKGRMILSWAREGGWEGEWVGVAGVIKTTERGIKSHGAGFHLHLSNR